MSSSEFSEDQLTARWDQLRYSEKDRVMSISDLLPLASAKWDVDHVPVFIGDLEHFLAADSDGIPTVWIRHPRRNPHNDWFGWDFIHWIDACERWITAEEWNELSYDERGALFKISFEIRRKRGY